jgi:tRNA (guanine37-N1)-methyltransferase
MPTEAPCLKVPKTDGEKTLTLANKLGLTNKNLIIQKDPAGLLCIPLAREPDEKELALLKKQIPEFQLATQVFPEKNQQPKTLAEVLQNQLPPNLLEALPRALDIVGDIAITEIPPALQTHKNLVGKAILKTHKSVRTVLAKAGAVSGTYRLREFDFIVGENKTATLYKEHGCSYYVDVAKAYFSPRLSHEHNRVASLVQNGETVVDLFAGVGPFVVPIAKKHPDVKVYGVDINPDAVALLEKNARLNRVENRVYPIVGDARQIVDDKLHGVADRVIMNLPEIANEFIDTACKTVKSTGGTVHFYGFIRLAETLEDMKQHFAEAVEKAGRTVESFSYAKTVRETAPHEYQAVLDSKIL